MTTTEIFMTMVDWIVDNTEMRNPTEALKKAGLDTANYSKIKSGTNKSVKYETMRKLNNAFGKPFNPEWMRCKSDVMLHADLTPGTATDRTAMDVSAQGHTDLTARLIAAKDELIRAKDDIIATFRAQLSDKDALIQSLRQQVLDLRA